MPGIFISYRREDSGGYARSLFESASSHFGKGRVFMDTASIEAGADFSEVIRVQLAHCNVFIALIGRNWLRCADESGRRRLERADDFVRLEVVQALGLGLRVIPVLVGGARMPNPEELPAEIRQLALHNAHEIPDQFFKQSVRQLIRLLETSVPRRGVLSRRAVVLAAGGASLLTGGIVTLSHRPGEAPSPKTGSPKSDATDLPKLETSNAPAHPPVRVKEPARVAVVPPIVPGPWDVATDVIGPRQLPHLLWAIRFTGHRSVVGFAPDQLVYLSDGNVLSGVRNGIEEWAYDEPGWFPDGVAPDGRFWLHTDHPRDVFCYNSRGEGGLIRGVQDVPRNVLPAFQKINMTSSETASCQGRTIEFYGRRDPIPLDERCSWVVRDGQGRFYVDGGKSGGEVRCLSSEGALLWKYDFGQKVSKPLFSLGDLILASMDRLFCVRDGMARWSVPMENCDPKLVDKAGTVYLWYLGSKIMAAIDRDGHFLWRLQAKYADLTLGPQGRLYLTDDDTIGCAGV